MTTVTVLASGLKLLSFQGVTVYRGAIVVATVEGDLVQVAADGTLTTWVNVTRYGIPTGIVGSKEGVVVALSAQESGHFLLLVSPQGKISILADLSMLAGEFGAPFGVDVREGYYPSYLVAISTDVVSSGGLIAQVTRSGKVNVLATVPETPFGVSVTDDSAIATQENGQIVKIDFTGKVEAIANTAEAELGSPLDITRFQDYWMLTTTLGWLVALKPDGNLSPLANITEAGFGKPTTLTTFTGKAIVATQTGNLLQVEFG